MNKTPKTGESTQPSWLRYGFLALVAAMVLAPVAVSASHSFTDVPDTNIFHSDIAWMADNGITSGCSPTEYCPGDNVTRGQMAKFLRNVAENKVVDAATADTATEADNAQTLSGKGQHSFQPALFAFNHEDSGAVSGNGTWDIAEATVTAAPTPLCSGFLQFPGADILVRATGYTNGVGVGELATLQLSENGVGLADTQRQVEESDGSFAMEWLFVTDGGEDTFGLIASEAGGDVYTVFEPQITIEVLQDTRCEGIVAVVLGDGAAAQDFSE